MPDLFGDADYKNMDDESESEYHDLNESNNQTVTPSIKQRIQSKLKWKKSSNGNGFSERLIDETKDSSINSANSSSVPRISILHPIVDPDQTSLSINSSIQHDRISNRSIHQTVKDEILSIYYSQKMSMKYLYSESIRSVKSFLIGCLTVLIVCSVILLIASNTSKSPLIFFRIAEISVGEMDLVLSPNAASANTNSQLPFFLNQTWIDRSLQSSPVTPGAAGRWLFFGRVSNPYVANPLPNTTASCVILGIDSTKEKQIGLGRAWDLPPLEGKSIYLSRSIVRQIGYELDDSVDKPVRLRLDLFDIAKQVGLLDNDDDADGLSLAQLEQLLYRLNPTAFPPTFWTQTTSLSIRDPNNVLPYPSCSSLYLLLITQSVYGSMTYLLPFTQPNTMKGYLNEFNRSFNQSITQVELFGALATAPQNLQPYIRSALCGQSIDVSNQDILELFLPTLIDAGRSDTNLTIKHPVSQPDGKWPEALGQIMLMESTLIVQLMKESFFDFIDYNISSIDLSPFFNQSIVIFNQTINPIIPIPTISLRSLIDALGNSSVIDPSINQAVKLIDSINGVDQALLSVVESKDRLSIYQKDIGDMKASLVDFTNAVSVALSIDFPATWTTPIAAYLEILQYIRYFLDNIFYSIVVLIVFLGSLLIYSLMLNDVSEKTYEYGMLRALGMKNRTLVQILLTKAMMFAIPGIAVGLLIAFLINIPVESFMAGYAVISPNYSFASWPLYLSIAVSFIMPLIANIVPIGRALGRTLRDSLDVYHHVVSDVTVKMIKLADYGLDLWQTALAILMCVLGFVTFYVVPYAFIFGNIPLFLGILNGILLGMLFGLCVINQSIQPVLERLILRIMLIYGHRHLRPVVVKNLSGHRARNAKTAQMFTICLAFIVFSGVMFALQANSLLDNLKLALGSDINVQVLPNDLANRLNEVELTGLLSNAQAKTLAGDPHSIVLDYTFVTFPLNNLPGVRAVQFSALPKFHPVRNYVYGVSENYLKVAYDEYYMVTQLGSGEGDYPLTPDGKPDAIAIMYTEAGRARLPEEQDGIRPPPNSPPDLFSSQQFNRIYNQTGMISSLNFSYTNYVDVIMGEALSGWQSVNVATAMNLNVRTHRRTSPNYEADYVQNRLCKARAMVSKVPGFLYSSYSVSASISSVLVRQDAYNALMLDALGPNDEIITNGLGSPKQRLMVRLKPGSTLDQREDLINSMRTFFTSDKIIVTDTLSIIDTTMGAVSLMNLFFTFVGIVTMLMCFFILWLSFTANVSENSWELGVLRALGLNSIEVLMVYVYEALAIVLASVIAGTAIGLVIAASLTAQFNLFTEMPFRMEFPHSLFWTLVILSLVIAVIGSAWPASKFLKKSISGVLRGQ